MPGPGDDRDGDGLGHGPQQVDASRRRSGPGPRRWCRPRPVRRCRGRPASGPATAAASRSSAPSSPNGVTMAVTTAPKRARRSPGARGLAVRTGAHGPQATSSTGAHGRCAGAAQRAGAAARPEVRPARARSASRRPRRRPPRWCRTAARRRWHPSR